MSASRSTVSHQHPRRPGLFRVLAIAIAIAGTCSSPATAADGADALLEKCSTADLDHVQSAMIAGVAMGLLLGQSLGGPTRKYCPPNSGRLSAGQYRQTACKFLGAHPNVAQQDQYTAVAIALLESYPCMAGQK